MRGVGKIRLFQLVEPSSPLADGDDCDRGYGNEEQKGWGKSNQGLKARRDGNDTPRDTATMTSQVVPRWPSGEPLPPSEALRKVSRGAERREGDERGVYEEG